MSTRGHQQCAQIGEAGRAGDGTQIQTRRLHVSARPQQPCRRENGSRRCEARQPGVATQGSWRHSKVLRKRVDSAVLLHRRRSRREQLAEHRGLDQIQCVTTRDEIMGREPRRPSDGGSDIDRRRCDEHTRTGTRCGEQRTGPFRRRRAEQQDGVASRLPRAAADERRRRHAIVILNAEHDDVVPGHAQCREHVGASRGHLENGGGADGLPEQRRLGRLAEQRGQHADCARITALGSANECRSSARHHVDLRRERSFRFTLHHHTGNGEAEIGHIESIRLRERHATVCCETLTPSTR